MAPSRSKARRPSMSDATEDDEKIPLDRRMKVACRLVPADQWLITHVDSTWTVRFAKIFLLARCHDPAKTFMLPPPVHNPPPPPPVSGIHIRPSQVQESSAADARSPSPALSTRSSLMTTSAKDDENDLNSLEGSDEAQLVFAIDPHDEMGSDSSDDIPAPRVYRHQYPRAKNGIISALPPSVRSSSNHESIIIPSSIISTSPSSTNVGPPALVHQPQQNFLHSLLQTTSEQAKHESYIRDRANQLHADDYTLCSFTTGQVLEEHLALSSYRFRPGELFEIQRKNAKVYLSRATYAEPYFDAPVSVHVTKEKESKASSSSPHPSPSGDLLPSPSFSHSTLSLHTRVDTPISSISPQVTGPPPVVVQTIYHHAHSPSASSTTSVSSRPLHQRQHSRDGILGIGSIGLSSSPPHRPPYRSQSAHFYPNQSNSSSKGKEKEKDSPMSIAGGFIPFHDSFSGISTAAKLKSDQKEKLYKDPYGKKEKEREKGAEKAKNWKSRWLVVKDGYLKIWKDINNDSTPLEQYSLSSMKAVKEVPVPTRIYEKTPNIGTTHLISVHFLVPREGGDSIHHHHHMPWKDIQSHNTGGGQGPRRPGYEVTVKIRLLDGETHDHLLRVLYRAFQSQINKSKSMDSQQQTPPPPLASSNALLQATEVTRTRSRSLSPRRKLHHRVSLRRRKRAESPNISSYSRTGSRNSSVASLKRFKDPYSDQRAQRKGYGESADERESESGVEMGRRKFSVDLDADGEESESVSTRAATSPPPLRSSQTSPNLLSSSPEQEEMRRKPTQTTQTKPPRRMSLSTALKERPLGNSDCYLKWRERLIKKSQLAGRGEPIVFRRKGRGRRKEGETLVKGPWQTMDRMRSYSRGSRSKRREGEVSEEDDGYEQGDESEATSTKQRREHRHRKRTAHSDRYDTSSDEESQSDFEWIGWKNDAGYMRERLPGSSTMGSSTPPARKPGVTGGVSGDVSPTGSSSFADAVMGRSRSKSVATITPHSPYPHHSSFLTPTSETGDLQASIPPPLSAVGSPKASPASSTFSTQVSSPTQLSRPATPGSAGGRRPRSSTVATAIASPTSPLGLGISMVLPRSPKSSTPTNATTPGGSGSSSSQGPPSSSTTSPRSPRGPINHQRSTNWTNPALALLSNIPGTSKRPLPRRATTTDSGTGYEETPEEEGKKLQEKDEEGKMFSILEALANGPGRRRGNSASTDGTEESDMSLTSALNLPDPTAPTPKKAATHPLTSNPAPLVLQKSPRVLTKERPSPSPSATSLHTPSSSQTPSRNSSSVTVVPAAQGSSSNPEPKLKKKSKPMDLKVVTDPAKEQ
ncbi:hypothetical protein FRC03_000757 [Tulasnella sp. 419]|nr:hypothetical protein FRC03_000757 [Tulasnella sp. 419]